MVRADVTFERRIEMLFFIMKMRYTTIMELTETFSVSRRTVFTDISFLSRYAPIYTKSGKYGGIYILDEYQCSLFRFLSDSQIEKLNIVLDVLTDEYKPIILEVIEQFSKP